MEKRNRNLKLLVGAIVVAACVLLLAGLFGGDLMYHLQNRGDLGPLTRDEIAYLSVDAPAATSKDGTITAADWAAVYPDISFTMGANDQNSYVTDYLEDDPYLVNIYEGFGFAKDYSSARGHAYTLEDVSGTERPHALANCLTCKTPNFTKLVNDQGVSAYTMPFDEAFALMEEDISCYNCHGNDAGNQGQITITHSYVTTALGENAAAIDPGTLSCGQCHIEYYFTVADGETMMPYSSVETMTPEAILAYYDSLDGKDGAPGFYDWIQESTGTRMLKAQHPELETYLTGVHAKEGLSCADCHMPIEMAEDGTVYHSHELVSPLESETLLSTCAQCHTDTDVTALVHGVQNRVTARETEVGERLSAYKTALAAAVASGEYSEEELAALRQLHRQAQWFFDFCYVENAEGAHNSALAFRCLELADALLDEAEALLHH